MNKVLMTADTLGGVWTFATTLVKELEKQQIEVHLATMGRPLSQQQMQQVAGLPNLYLYQSDYQLEWMQNPWQDVHEAGLWLLRLEAEIQPDVVHLNNYGQVDLPWKTPVLLSAHSDVCSWHEHVKGEQADGHWELYQTKVEQALNTADQLVAVSTSVKNDLHRHYYLKADTQVIHNGLPPEGFYTADPQPFFLSMGRVWDEAKNYNTLNQAAPGIDWEVQVAGEKHHPAYDQQSAYAHLNLLGNLPRKELQHKLAQAAVYVHPARYEPFGLTPLEAAFSGCALLLADIATLREIWKGAALFFDPADATDLKDKMKMLQVNKHLREELSQKAKEKAKNYQAHKMANNYLKLYHQLIAEKENVEVEPILNYED